MNKTALVLSLIAVAGLAHADLKSEITAGRHKIENAALAKDAKAAKAAYAAMVTSDFKYVQDGKSQDYKTFVKNFTDGFAMMDKTTMSSSRFISLHQKGSNGTGEVEFMMAGTMKNPDKSIHKMNWVGHFTEDYRKVGGKWKIATMTAGKQKFLVDGKPMKM